MTKKKKKQLKRFASRTKKYSKSFISGYKRTLSVNVRTLSHNMLRSRISAVNVRNRKARMLARDVNYKLQQLQKWGRYDTWASKQLINRLDGEKLKLLDKSGLINLDRIKDLTDTQITTMNKAMNQFMRSKTKTIQGINAVVRKKRQDLIEKSDNAQWVKSLSNKEIESLYRVFDDEEFDFLSDKVKYEQIWKTIVEANSKQYTEEDFISELQLYTDPKYINDQDVLDSMESMYDKFVNLK